jgi:hypothetical protein
VRNTLFGTREEHADMRGLVAGGASGVVATVAMSAVMLAGEKAGLMEGQPPRHIVRAVLPGHKRRPKQGEKPLGIAMHFAFGTTMGALFGLLSRGHRTPIPYGIGYGLAVWLASYEGWLPSMGILPPVSEERRAGRPLVMAAAHVVYGATLVAAMNRMSRSVAVTNHG